MTCHVKLEKYLRFFWLMVGALLSLGFLYNIKNTPTLFLVAFIIVMSYSMESFKK